MNIYRPVLLATLIVSLLGLASCASSSRIGRAPETRQPMVVTLSPESLRALQQQSAYAPVHARLDGMWMECRRAEPERQRVTMDETRVGLYRAVAGFVAGAVVTPALAAVSPRVGAAWVDVLNEFQGRRDVQAQDSMWCRQVR